MNVKVRVLVAAFVTCLGTSALAQEAPPPTAEGPRIAVEPPSFDFGRALQNRELTKEFTIRNFGSKDLVIESVATSCGCTATNLKNKTVKPGGSTPLEVRLQTRSFAGRIAKSVLIRSNDPSRKSYDLKVEATVVKEE